MSYIIVVTKPFEDLKIILNIQVKNGRGALHEMLNIGICGMTKGDSFPPAARRQ